MSRPATRPSSNCACGTGFTTVYTSPGDAFPGVAPRPVAPDLIMRSFNLPTPVTADYLRLVVDTNQCTGGPAYAGEQDNDPPNRPDGLHGGRVGADGLGLDRRGRGLHRRSSRRSRRPAVGDRVLVHTRVPGTRRSNPRTSVTFNESDMLRTFGVFSDHADPTTQHLALFYNDEHAMTLGVNPFVTPMTTNPGHARTRTWATRRRPIRPAVPSSRRRS